MAVGQVGFGIGGAVAGPLYVARGYEGSVLAAAGAAFLFVPVTQRFLPSYLDGMKETGAPPAGSSRVGRATATPSAGP